MRGLGEAATNLCCLLKLISGWTDSRNFGDVKFSTLPLCTTSQVVSWSTTSSVEITDTWKRFWPNVWHKSDPLSIANNTLTLDIVDLISNEETCIALAGDYPCPITIPVWLDLVGLSVTVGVIPHILTYSSECNIPMGQSPLLTKHQHRLQGT